ncbi:hypothetical protein J3R82DRAFT_8980 [Butyriboletus roseoflavus]|nr:hypothetical protein J3R82DRAFT_8980 [Butyriboletus roseoflavus]
MSSASTYLLKTLLALSLVLVSSMIFGFGKKKWDPRGKHVYITGGSQGLGLALAKILAKRGANISIVARTQSKLDDALKELKALRVSPMQSFQAFSFSLASASASAEALAAATAGHGEFPDAVFCCAGAAKPMFLVDMSEADVEGGMRDGYWVQAWTAWAAVKEMARRGQKGKIILVSSTLGFMSFVGYGSYSPAKHALRALAECLRSEGLLYGITAHIFFPPTMYTPGFDAENKTKPAITRKIESTDEGLTAEQAAKGLFNGVENGEFHITADLITSLFKASTRGSAPRGNALFDTVLDVIALIGVPIWRRSVDNQVVAHREEHNTYLRQKGFFDDST